jgi:hypothetical protein
VSIARVLTNFLGETAHGVRVRLRTYVEEYAAKPGDPILTGQLVAEQVIGVG